MIKSYKTIKEFKMKRILLLILISACFTFAQEFKKTGTAGFIFLEVPVSARSAALGEAAIALGDLNSDAIFINPGVLGFSPQIHSLSVSYANWIADIRHIASSYAFKTGAGVFSVGVNAFDFGTMPRTVKVGGQRVYDVLGTFSANALALSFGYSRQLTDKFSFGVALKYANEKIDIYHASNLLFDGGILYYTGFGSFRVAAAIQNFGTETKYRSDMFRMPTLFKLGAAMEVFGGYNEDYRVTAVFEAIHPNDNNERINVGVETSYQNMVTLRGGYKFFYDEETYSIGIGINPKLPVPITADFAYVDFGRLGDILRFTIQFGLL